MVDVVDNLSPDNSMMRLQKARAGLSWAERLTVRSAGRNGGFAAGNNVAIRRAQTTEDPPTYYHLLNPDTLVEPKAIETLVQFMEANPQVGIAGSGLQSDEGVPQSASHTASTASCPSSSAASGSAPSRNC